MARRGEDTTPKLQNFQAGPSWMPATPAKPDSTRQQPICANWQENQHVQTNWLEPKILSRVNQVTQGNWSDTGRLPGNFVVETPSQTLPCYSSINSVYESGDFATWGVGEAANSRVYRDALRGFDTWQAGNVSNSHVQGEDLRRNDKISVDDAEKWTMSFGNLLALAHGVGNTSAAVGNTSAENAAMQAGFVATSSTFAPSFLPYTEGQSMISFGNSSAPELDNLLVRNFEDGLKRMPNILRDRSSIPSRPFFDLNSPPRTIRDAALSIGTPSHFQPITPEKTSKAEQLRESAIIDLTADDVPLAKDVQKNIIAGDELKGHYEKKEQSQPVTYQSYETTLTELSENHKPDKGGTAEADSSKTPQQKPRRRKHRPKVIIEGQTKRTPKPHSEIPSASQETPSVKRKYVRRKAVDNTNTSAFEGETNENDSSKKTPPKDTPVGKRKYVRKKRKEESEANTDERNSEMTEPKTVQNTRNSCRRSLNFTLDSQVRDEGSSYSPSSNCNMELQAENFGIKVPSKTPSMHCGQGTGEKNDMGIAYELTKTAYQDVQDYLSRPGIQTLSCSPPIKPDSLQYGYRISDTRGKCQLVFSDVTHDKEVNTAHVTEHTDSRQWTPKSPNNSIGSSTCFIQGKQPRGFKRQHMGNTVEEELCSTNGSGAFNNSMQMYLSLFSKNADKNDCTSGMHFPTIYKKKRTEKGLNAATSSSQYTACASNTKLAGPAQRDSYLSASTSRGFLVAPYEATNLLMTNPAPHGTQTGRQDFEDLLTLGPTEKIKRKRSKVPTRVRDLASLLEICKEPVSPGKAAKTSKSKRGIEIHREPYTCMEALVADTCSTMTTKKRSKRSLVNSTSQSFSNHHEFANKSTGPPLAITWTYMSPIDSMIDQLNQLDLNGESSHSAQKQNEFTAYEMHYQEQHALVPYQSGGAVVPFDGSLNQVKKRRPRPKVNLDDETTRVWKLLLENINSEGIDGTDEDKTKWWEEERRVFNGRADSFIARMHLVQGDRRFSPWKGSVLDSVVGVFLTQNVSDHLSSSAFMSLAARFPIVSENNAAEFHEARENTQTREPEICVLDSDETFGSNNDDLLESACREDAEMLQDFEDSDSRVADSIKFSSDDTIPKDNCGGQSPDVAKLGPVVSTESVPNKSVSVIGEGREMDDTVSSQASVISSQNSEDSPITQTTERTDSCSLSNSEEEPAAGVKPNRLVSSTSFVKLLQMAGSVILHGVYEEGSDKKVSDDNQQLQLETLALNSQNENPWGYPAFSTKPSSSCNESALGALTNLEVHAECLDLSKKHSNYSDTSSRKETCGTETSGLSAEFAPKTTSDMSMAVHSKGSKLPCPDVQQSNNDKIEIGLNKVEKQTGQVPTQSLFPENSDKVQDIPDIATFRQNLMDVTASSSITDNSRNSEHKEVNSSKNDPNYLPVKTVKEPKAKGKRTGKEKQNTVDWDNLRKQAQEGGRKRERTANTMDSVDWDAVRCADVNEIAETIKERGMNNMLAERIKDFLNRLVRDHETLDLEWLRDVPPDKAKEYLLSIRGLGLKSVECVRLLTLHHLAFPVDTNVGRIAVRLGWVPLQPLPESLQLHLLELYPILESIQKYLWPRLCKLDQRTLYELHYQMITFGKVFCTKSKPNCNACPMRGECRHFASAFASARLALPAPEEKSIVNASENRAAGQNPVRCMNTLQLPSPQADLMRTQLGVSNSQPIIEEPASPEPIVEVPDTPEPEYTQVPECDIEDTFGEDPDEIPTIQLNIEQFTQNLQRVMQQNTELQEGDMSRALVALTPDAASIPMPKLKNMSRLRTEHQVYELPDSHPLLEGMDKREPDDPSPYLLAIWTPGETVDSIEPPQTRCSSSQGSEKLCTDQTCLSCSSLRELKSQTVRGTLLIPCRTAMRGSFPLNGTYFQVNEVFSDHESSLTPMDVPREWLWNLPRRTVYFGTSIPTIFKGLTTEGIQYCFWRGFVCVRGFDRRNRAPRPLIARLHFPASKLAAKGKGKADDN